MLFMVDCQLTVVQNLNSQKHENVLGSHVTKPLHMPNQTWAAFVSGQSVNHRAGQTTSVSVKKYDQLADKLN